MASGTFFSLCLFFAGSAFAMMLADNQFAKDFHWAVPWLWGSAGVSLSFALASARWCRKLLFSEETIKQKAAEQETRGANSPAFVATHGSTINFSQGASSPAPRVTLPSGHIVEGNISAVDFGESDTTLTTSPADLADNLAAKIVFRDHRRTTALAQSKSALAFCEIGNRQHFFPAPHALLNIFVVGVKNTLLASAKSIHNVKAQIEYYFNGTPEFVVSPIRWEENRRKGLPLMNATTVDLEPNESHCIPVFMEGADHAKYPQQPTLPQTAFDELWRTRSLVCGKWTARITVTADYCEPLIGEIDFTIANNPGESVPFVGVHPPLGAMRLPLPDSGRATQQHEPPPSE